MKIFRGSEENVLPDLNLSAKKKLNSVYLLSDKQEIIAFSLYIDPVSIIKFLNNYIASESALISLL